MNRAATLVVIALLAAGGCKPRTPTSATVPEDLPGIWRGTINDPVVGSAQLTLTLRPLTGGAGFSAITGTWQVSFPPGRRTSNGVVTGLQQPGAADLWLIYLDPLGFPPCFDRPAPFSTHGEGFELNVIRTGNRLTGPSTYRTCSEAFDGSVDLAR